MAAPQPATNNSTDFTQPALPTSVLRFPICSVDTQIITKDHVNNTRGQTERLRELNEIKTRTGANYLAMAMPYDNITTYTNWVNDARTLGFKINFRSHWDTWQGDNGVGNIATSTSLTQTGNVATCVTQTAHGLNTGDTVSMNGMNEHDYRGEFVCTVINSTTFTYPIANNPASPATGAGIGWRWGRQTYLDHTYDFIITNQALFQPGDMFAFCVEADQATSGGNMCFYTAGTTNFDFSLYNAFQINQVRYANYAFAQIPRLAGKIHTWAISHGVSNLNLNGQTVNTGGSTSTGNASGLANSDMVSKFASRVSIDHYIDASVITASAYGTQYTSDINAFIAAFPCVNNAGGGLLPAEWGFHTGTDYGDQVQFDVYTKVGGVWQSKAQIIGGNFWNHLGQLSSSIWTDISGTVVLGGRQAVGAVRSTFVLPPSTQNYVTTKGTQLYLNGQPWQLFGCTIYNDLNSDLPTIAARMVAVAAAGYNTVRFTNFFNLSGAVGSEFSEPIYQTIDYALNQARLNGLKVIFETNIAGIATARGYAQEDSNWYALYLSFFNWLPNRVNTVNGITYKNDDTICMYSIEGESSVTGPAFNTVAGYIRANDTSHLITPGAQNPERILDSSYGEGAYPNEDILQYANIDIASTEGYYTRSDMARLFPKVYDYAKKRNKPWIIIEFGFDATYWNDFHRCLDYRFVLDTGLKNYCSGFIFWNCESGGSYNVNPNTPEVYNITRIYAKTTKYSPRLKII